MAINPGTLPDYNGQVNPPDADYPYSSARDDAVPGDLTGTPRVAAEQNDLKGWQQKLLTAAAIIPSGDPETVLASQYFEATNQLKTTPVTTTAVMQANADAKVGMRYKTDEFLTGNGGGGTYTVIVTGTTPGVDLPNARDILVGTADPLVSFVLKKGKRTAFVAQWGAVSTTADSRAAIQAATDYISAQGGGDVIIDILAAIAGVASPDALLNGILVPFVTFDNSQAVRIRGGILGGGLQALSNDMALVRASNPGTVCRDLTLNANGKAGVWAMACVPEDRNQIITLVSQSYCKMLTCNVNGCEEGIVVEPGPTVAASQSGAFYPIVDNCDFNQNTRSMWFKESITDASNRPTRGNLTGTRMERGNVGIDLEYATEFTMRGNNFQFMTFAGPLATASAIHLGPKSENNYLYGGNAEVCDADINNESTLPNALMIHGFALTGTNINIGVLPVVQPHLVRVTDRTSATEKLSYQARNSTFAELSFDYNATGAKDANIETNGVRRMSWFNGTTTHYGSGGDITFAATGAAISSSATSLTFNSDGFMRLRAASDAVYIGVAADDYRFSSANVRPTSDNTKGLGEASLRFTEVFAAVGSINTSDATHKTDIRLMVPNELNAAKQLSKEVGIYQFLASVEAKGDAARQHVGMTVQRAIEIMEGHGLAPFSYGFICFDEWDAIAPKEAVYMEVGKVIHPAVVEPEVLRFETGEVIVPEKIVREAVLADGTELLEAAVEGREAGSLYSFRPDQLNAFMIRGLEQRLAEAGI